MEELNGLKRSLNFYWYIGLVFYILILFSPVFRTEEPYKEWLRFSLNYSNNDTLYNKVLLFISVANLGFFVLTIKYLRELTNNFNNDLFFEEETLILMKKIGKSLCISASIYGLIGMISMFIDLNTHYQMFLYAVLIMAVGQFFLILQGVFRRAKQMKEENELTI